MTMFVLAATIALQPLADPDILEPSVMNEVEHAITRAPKDARFGTLADFLRDEKALSGKEGETKTDLAVRLVSAQGGDGRWRDAASNDVTCAAVHLLKRAAGISPRLKFSIFSDHIEEAAEQSKIPLAEVAKRVRALGFEGVDIWSSTRRATIKLYRDAGFSISCVIWFPHFDERYDEAKGREIVDKAVANGCDRILVVPATTRGSLAGDPAVRALVIERTERYAAYAAEKGVVVTIEDYDNAESPTADIANTKDFLKRAPHVRLAFDTGNFHFRGESAEDALKELAGSVSHFHLKDRPVESRDTKYSVAFGTGAIPARRMIELPREVWGYDGWFTLEHFGVTNMLETIETSAKFLSTLGRKPR